MPIRYGSIMLTEDRVPSVTMVTAPSSSVR